jgi:hypothetical protein
LSWRIVSAAPVSVESIISWYDEELKEDMALSFQNAEAANEALYASAAIE